MSPRPPTTEMLVRIDHEGSRIEGVSNTHLDFAAIYLVRRGRAIHVIDGVPHGVSRGDVFLMSAGATHSYHQLEQLSLDAFYYRPRYLESCRSILEQLPGYRPELLSVGQPAGGKWLHLPPSGFAALRPMVEEIRREWLADTPDGRLLSQTLFFRLVIQLCRLAAETHPIQTEPREEREWIVSEAVAYLDRQYPEAVRMRALAGRLGVSPDCLTNWFSKVMGRTPRDYLRHVRLERAQHLLRTTDLAAHEIGRRVGYPDPAQFTRVFSASFGLTPGAFRTRAFRLDANREG